MELLDTKSHFKVNEVTKRYTVAQRNTAQRIKSVSDVFTLIDEIQQTVS